MTQAGLTQHWSHRWFFHSQQHKQIPHLLSQLFVVQRLGKSIPTWRGFKVNWLVMSLCVNHWGEAAPSAGHGWSSVLQGQPGPHTQPGTWHGSSQFPLTAKQHLGRRSHWSFDVCDTQCNLDEMAATALTHKMENFQGAAVPARQAGTHLGIRGNCC